MKKNAKKTGKATTKGTKAAKATKPQAERKPTAEKPARVRALDAAATVLQKSGKPMRSQDVITAMAEQGFWTSPNGKTLHATLYAAILREIGTKKSESNSRKWTGGSSKRRSSRSHPIRHLFTTHP